MVTVAMVGAGALLAGALLTQEVLPAGEDTPPPAPASSSAAAPVRAPDFDQARLDAMHELLRQRGTALQDRDRALWVGTADPTALDYVARHAAVFDNLERVPLESVRFEFAGEGPLLSAERVAEVGPGAWVARVVMVYRLADADVADVRRERYLTLVERAGSWFVADDTDGAQDLDLWDLGPVAVVRGDRSLVLGTVEEPKLQDIATRTDSAARRVDTVWGSDWARTVVVQVPRDQSQMAALLNRTDETGLEQIAAVTTGEVGQTNGPAADRVIVNPAGFARLQDSGPDVVLTHEITHVATRAQGPGQVPLWVSEGFADYVAYHGMGLSRRQVAADVLDQVARGNGPTALPSDPDFDPANGLIAPSYSASWLAFDLIARDHGQDKAVAFYRTQAGVFSGGRTEAVPAPLSSEEAFRTVLRTDQASFQALWLEHLESLAG